MSEVNVLDIVTFIFKSFGDFLTLSFQFKIIYGISLLHIEIGVLVYIIMLKLIRFGGELDYHAFHELRKENKIDKANEMKEWRSKNLNKQLAVRRTARGALSRYRKEKG